MRIAATKPLFAWEELEDSPSLRTLRRLLVLLVDRRWQPAQLVRAGFDPELIERVLRMIRRNQYKRRLPVIAKLTHRTMDRDFRYQRDWGT